MLQLYCFQLQKQLPVALRFCLVFHVPHDLVSTPTPKFLKELSHTESKYNSSYRTTPAVSKIFSQDIMATFFTKNTIRCSQLARCLTLEITTNLSAADDYYWQVILLVLKFWFVVKMTLNRKVALIWANLFPFKKVQRKNCYFLIKPSHSALQYLVEEAISCDTNYRKITSFERRNESLIFNICFSFN